MQHVTQGLERPTNPNSSFCTVQRRRLLPSAGCCQLIQGQSTGGIAAETDSFSLPWTQLTSPAGLETGLLKCYRCDLFLNTMPQEPPCRWVWICQSPENLCSHLSNVIFVFDLLAFLKINDINWNIFYCSL